MAGNINIKFKIGLADSIIAATAIKNNIILLTRNIKHFKNVDKLKVNKPYN